MFSQFSTYSISSFRINSDEKYKKNKFILPFEVAIDIFFHFSTLSSSGDSHWGGVRHSLSFFLFLRAKWRICNSTAVNSIVCIGNLKCCSMLMENSNTINNFVYEIVGQTKATKMESRRKEVPFGIISLQNKLNEEFISGNRESEETQQ